MIPTIHTVKTFVEEVLDDRGGGGDDARWYGEGAGQGFTKKCCVQGGGLECQVYDRKGLAQLYCFGVT